MSTRHSYVAKHIKLKIQSFISFFFFLFPLIIPGPPSSHSFLSSSPPQGQSPSSRSQPLRAPGTSLLPEELSSRFRPDLNPWDHTEGFKNQNELLIFSWKTTPWT